MLDTNVLISAFVFRSEKLYNMIDFIVNNHELVISSFILDELRAVVAKKFPKMEYYLDEFLEVLPFTFLTTPDNVKAGLFEIRDEFDYPILYAAIIENIDIFITGDKDFSQVRIQKPMILTPAEFQSIYTTKFMGYE